MHDGAAIGIACAQQYRLGTGGNGRVGIYQRLATPVVQQLCRLLQLRNALLHPVPLPIMAGLLFAQTGWTIPAAIDRPLELLASAFGPLALVLVGVTLANTPIGRHWRTALALAGVKNLLHPLLVFGLCRLLGVGGLPMTVMVVAASLPIGANVFLFSQRYQVAEELVTASVAVSTALALVSLTLVLMLIGTAA